MTDTRAQRVDDDDALALFRRVVDGVDAAALDACAAAVVRDHPVVRALAPIAATPHAWLDLFCRSWMALHPACAWQWQSRSERFVLSTTASAAAAARGLIVFSRAMVRHVPVALGARPLAAPTTTDGVTWTFMVPAGLAAAARVARATDIPLVAVVGALHILTSPPPEAAALPAMDADATLPPPTGATTSAGGAPHGDAVTAFATQHGLTVAEARVLRALDGGLRPADVAAVLGVATGTVRVHLKRIYRKTGTHGQRPVLARLAAVRALLHAGATRCTPSD